jgi:hypothetical protein
MQSPLGKQKVSFSIKRVFLDSHQEFDTISSTMRGKKVLDAMM